jgi:nitrogen regulatory protein PII 2
LSIDILFIEKSGVRNLKEVVAIIRMNMMNQTKQALGDAGISSFTATGRVAGRGKGQVDFRILQGAEEGHMEAISLLGKGPRLIPKRLLYIVVPDKLVKTVVETIIHVNQTGKPGDGKIFVVPILDAVRVRTAETGDQVLDE